MVDRDFDPVIALQGEMIAVQALIAGLCASLSRRDPLLAEAVQQGFDATNYLLETSAVQLGTEMPPEFLAHAFDVIEKLRPR
jgi:hypothetical protein